MAESKRSVYLHIGTAKSGTTYLQQVLRENRRALRANGVLYPRTSQFHAALDLRQLKFAAVEDPRSKGAWKRLVAEIEAWSGPVVVSHELLAGTRPKLVVAGLEDLAFADVHVVLTIRGMAQTLPAAWQERVKLGGTETFESFVAAVRRSPPAGGKEWTSASHKFWNLHNVPSVLTKWARDLPPENVHVVAVPPPTRTADGLWERFARVVGLDPNAYEVAAGRLNESMGAAETTVLRQFNEAVGSSYPWDVYSPLVKSYLASELGARHGSAIALPEADSDWARAWTVRTVEAIKRSRYEFVGELTDLTVAGRRRAVAPEAVSSGDQLAAAIGAMASLARFVAADTDSHTPLTRRVLSAQLRRSRHDARHVIASSTRARLRRMVAGALLRSGWLGPVRRGVHTVRSLAGTVLRRGRRVAAR